MKKRTVAMISVAVLLVDFIISNQKQLKDGGSVQYKSLTYEINKGSFSHFGRRKEKEGKIKPYDHGYTIKILGFEIYNDVI